MVPITSYLSTLFAIWFTAHSDTEQSKSNPYLTCAAYTMWCHIESRHSPEAEDGL
jgi:hypothetical protein